MCNRCDYNSSDNQILVSKFRFLLAKVEYIASLYNCDIEINDNTEKSEQQELVEDLA